MEWIQVVVTVYTRLEKETTGQEGQKDKEKINTKLLLKYTMPHRNRGMFQICSASETCAPPLDKETK